MQAKDVMTHDVVTALLDTPVEDIAHLLIERRISAVPIVDQSGALVGIVSEGDLMRRSETGTERRAPWWLLLVREPSEQALSYVKSHGRLAKHVMTRNVVTVGEDAPLSKIAELLEKHRIKRVPVLRGQELVGIVSRANLLQGLVSAPIHRPMAASDADIRDAITQALRDEAGVQHQFINVMVSDGVAHLWGFVDSTPERQAAQVAAENVEGVQTVDNHLSVLPPQVQAAFWAE